MDNLDYDINRKVTVDDLREIKKTVTECMGHPLSGPFRVIPNELLPDNVIMVSCKMYDAIKSVGSDAANDDTLDLRL